MKSSLEAMLRNRLQAARNGSRSAAQIDDIVDQVLNEALQMQSINDQSHNVGNSDETKQSSKDPSKTDQ